METEHSLLGFSWNIFAQPVHAAVVVSEIMYNPPGTNTGHQWIEVENTGPDSIDLGAKNIRLFDASGNHLIKAYEGDSTVLATGDVAVIAKDPITFLSDYGNFSGTLLKSSFTLGASSGIIGIVQTDGTILARAAYSSSLGAAGDGNSLQRLVNSGNGSGNSSDANSGTGASGVFHVAAPTPGIVPETLPAPLAAPVKLSSSNFGTNKGTSKRASGSSTASSKRSSSTKSKNTYGKGTLAPSAEADASADGALSTSFSFPSISFPFLNSLQPVFASVWFAGFLGLLAFSTFSLILIQRTRYL